MSVGPPSNNRLKCDPVLVCLVHVCHVSCPIPQGSLKLPSPKTPGTVIGPGNTIVPQKVLQSLTRKTRALNSAVNDLRAIVGAAPSMLPAPVLQ